MLAYAVLLSPLLAVARGNSAGAPSVACGDMTPHHNLHSPQELHSALYRLQTVTTCRPGEPVAVRISGAEFKGFMLKASGGAFQNTRSVRTMSCSALADTATHGNSETKDFVDVMWVAPSTPGVYTFRATVVGEFSMFWVGFSTTVRVI
ncbi:putative defense protein 3 [Branchiostoma floridae x Branchiostoma belcheri]